MTAETPDLNALRALSDADLVGRLLDTFMTGYASGYAGAVMTVAGRNLGGGPLPDGVVRFAKHEATHTADVVMNDPIARDAIVEQVLEVANGLHNHPPGQCDHDRKDPIIVRADGYKGDGR